MGCAVYNNMIYAVGGRDDCTELSSAERYNPATNTWSPIVAMMSRRSGVSLNDLVLALEQFKRDHFRWGLRSLTDSFMPWGALTGPRI